MPPAVPEPQASKSPPPPATGTGEPWPAPACAQSAAHLADQRLAQHGTGTGTVTVVVVVDGFHYGGRDYRWRDQLQIPAEHLDTWLDSGHVRLAEQGEHDVHGIVETFLGGRR